MPRSMSSAPKDTLNTQPISLKDLRKQLSTMPELSGEQEKENKIKILRDQIASRDRLRCILFFCITNLIMYTNVT